VVEHVDRQISLAARPAPEERQQIFPKAHAPSLLLS